MVVREAVKLAVEELIKPFEGYHLRLPNGSCTAYPDPATNGDPWTIGYGSTGPEVYPGVVWSHDKAELELFKDVAFFVSGVLELSPGLINELPRRLAAIISFAYNCGLGNYRISTLRKRVNEKNWEEAAVEILKWNKAGGKVLKGLTRRRKAESLLLL